MKVEVLTSAAWRELGKKFKAAANGKTVRLALTKGIQSEVRPAVADVKRAAKALEVRGVRGGGSKHRATTYRELHPKGRVKAHGLRNTVARSIKSRVKYSGNSVGVRVYSDPSVMPIDQRRLPAHLDNPRGWRHPVFGNRNRWAQQYGGPFFDRPLRQRTTQIRDAARRYVDDALRELE